MVKKGEYVDFAADYEWDESDPSSPRPSTEMACIVEMARKIKELEARIIALENP